MIQSSRTSAARLLAIAGLINGVLGIVLQYVLFQPLFARMGLGWISSAGFMLFFFTVLTNLMVVAVYWSSLAGTRNPVTRLLSRPGVRTAVTAYILLVGIIYATLLHGQLPLTPAQQVPDAMLHFIAPPLCVAWWWLSRPADPLSFSRIPRWMIWPVSYLAANLGFGAMTGVYIYPILDPGHLGWPAVTVVATGMIVLLAGLMAVLVMVTRRAPAPS
jgi:hypothetical protein